jgi:hypothetical protein
MVDLQLFRSHRPKERETRRNKQLTGLIAAMDWTGSEKKKKGTEETAKNQRNTERKEDNQMKQRERERERERERSSDGIAKQDFFYRMGNG